MVPKGHLSLMVEYMHTVNLKSVRDDHFTVGEKQTKVAAQVLEIQVLNLGEIKLHSLREG